MGIYIINCPSCNGIHNDHLALNQKLLEDQVEKLQQEMKVVEDERDAARARAEGWHTEMQKYALNTPQSQLQNVEVLQYDLNSSRKHNARLQKMLDEQEATMRKVDELESELRSAKSELRSAKSALTAYIAVAGRRYKRIAELEDTLKNVRLAAGLTPAAPGPILRSDD